jgi:heme/copper-type cytochrome/quinol oxidase subunit 2
MAGRIEEIAATILDGRPNGMPSFRSRITDDQAWQLATYVRSLSARTRQDMLAGRADEPPMSSRPRSTNASGATRDAQARRRDSRMRRSVPFALAPVLAACGGVQSSAGRDGVESDRIAGLFELFLWTTIAVYAFVIVFLVMAVVRGRRRSAADAPPQPDERRWRLGLYAFAGTSAAILFVLSLATFLTDRGIARAQPPPALEIELIGHQWWWEVRYRDPIAGNIVRTANELHLPAGKTARIKLLSTDVIHSLWIPKLAGKQDLIPGARWTLCCTRCGRAITARNVPSSAVSSTRTWRSTSRSRARLLSSAGTTRH